MTTELVAIIVSGLVSVLVVLINAISQARLNRQTRDAQSKLARQQRVAETYVDMLHMVHWQMEAVYSTKPLLTQAGEPSEPPAQPDTARLLIVQARIGAQGSPEVKEILQRWASHRRDFFADAWQLGEMEKHRTEDLVATYGVSLADQRMKVHTAKQDLNGIVRELEEVVSAELR